MRPLYLHSNRPNSVCSGGKKKQDCLAETFLSFLPQHKATLPHQDPAHRGQPNINQNESGLCNADMFLSSHLNRDMNT